MAKVRSSWGELNTYLNNKNKKKNETNQKKVQASRSNAGNNSQKTVKSNSNTARTNNNTRTGSSTGASSRTSVSRTAVDTKFNKGLNAGNTDRRKSASSRETVRDNFKTTRHITGNKSLGNGVLNIPRKDSDLGERHIKNIRAAAGEAIAGRSLAYNSLLSNPNENKPKSTKYYDPSKDGQYAQMVAKSQNKAFRLKQQKKDIARIQSYQDEQEKIREGASNKFSKFLWEMESAATGIAMDQLLGGGNPTASLGNMFMRSAGTSYKQAREEGASDGRARLYGAVKGGIEVGTEKMFGGLGILAGYGRGAGDEVVERAMTELADRVTRKMTKEGTRKATHFGIRYSGTAITEALEEMVAEGLDPIVANNIYANLVSEQTGNDVRHSVTVGDILYAGAGGAFLGALGGSPTIASRYRNEKKKREVYGTDGIKSLADKASKTDETIEGRDIGEIVNKRLAEGKIITDGHIAELERVVDEQRRKDFASYRASEIRIGEEMRKRNLANPYTVMEEDENGNMVAGGSNFVNNTVESNLKTSENAVNQAVEKLNTQEGKEYQLSEEESRKIAKAVSDVMSGIDYDGEMFSSGNELARMAYEEATGEALPSGNVATREYLNAKRAENLINLAEMEKANTIDRLNGMLVDSKSAEKYGPNTINTLNRVLDELGEDVVGENAPDVLTTFEHYTDAARYGISFEEMEQMSNPRYQTLTKEARRLIYDSAVSDNSINSVMDGAETKAGESIKSAVKKYSGASAKGNLITDNLGASKVDKLPQSRRRSLEALAKALGVDIYLFDEQWLKTKANDELGKTVYTEEMSQKGVTPNGFRTDDGIYINIDSDKSIEFTVAHETLHHVKEYAPEEYKQMKDLFVQTLIELKGGHEWLDSRVDSVKEIYARSGIKLDDQGVIEEIMADNMVEVFESEDFWNKIGEREPSLAKAMLDAIKEIMAKIRQAIAGSLNANTDNAHLFESLGILGRMEDLAAEAYTKAMISKDKGVDDIRFSLPSTDSEGRTLSASQLEYFKDSKIRDDDGNLVVVYHGTSEEFSVFDSTKSRANMDIQGNFFSPYELDAQGYGDYVGAYYLNITNPAPEGVGYSALNRFKGENNAGVKARDYLIELGYDGVNNSNEEYIAFYPNQIKAVGNVDPSSDADVNFSISTEYEEDVKHKNPASSGAVLTTKSNSGPPVLMSGREARTNRMREHNFTEGQIENVNFFFDHMSEFMDKLGYKYRYIGLNDVKNAKVMVRYENGEPSTIVMSAMLKNGEYPVNFDFSSICKKREGMMQVIKALTNTPTDNGNNVFDSIDITDEQMWKINNALREEGFETACLGCFVESRRYNSQKMYDKIDKLWNGNVKRARKKLGLKAEEWFNFADSNAEITPITEEDIALVNEVWEEYDKSNASKKSPALRTELLFNIIIKRKDVNHPYLRMIKPSDVFTPEGTAGFKQLSAPNHDIVTMLKSFYGTSAAKEILAFTPYNSEIAMLPAKMKNMEIGEYLKGVGGVRTQSFSDFKIENFFDYMQMVADMAAREFTGHAYTKELAFASIFGKTGMKINMSVMFDVDEEFCTKYGEQYAGLQFIDKETFDESKYFTDTKQPYSERTGKRYAKPHTLSDGREGYLTYLVGDRARSDAIYEKNYKKNLENGMSEENAQKLANISRPFTQSIDMDEAIELQNKPGYNENVGIIAVAYSDEHMKMLLDDPEMRYVIPYHLSGLPKFISSKSRMKMAHDFTSTQNTNKNGGITKPNGKKFDVKGELNTIKKNKSIANPYIELYRRMNEEGVKFTFETKTDKQKIALAGTNGFDVYESLERLGDPKKVANEYIKYCESNKYIPIFPEYAGLDGYYKTLFDFSVTDGINVYPQRAVTNTYPGVNNTAVNMADGNADFSELENIIDKAAEVQNNLNIERNTRMNNVMDKLLSEDSNYNLLSGTNINALKYNEIDYGNPKYTLQGEDHVGSDTGSEMANTEDESNGKTQWSITDSMPSHDDILDYVADHPEEFPEGTNPNVDTQEGIRRKQYTVNGLLAKVEKLKAEKKLTHGKRLNEKTIRKDVNELVRTLLSGGYNSSATNNDIVNGIIANARDIFSEIKSGNWDEVVDLAYYTAREVVESLTIRDDYSYNEYRDLVEELRDRKIEVTEEVKKNIADYNDFRKSNMGKLKLANEGAEIDVLYEDLCERYPSLFDNEITHPAEQLQEIARVRESLSPYDTLIESEEMENLVRQTASDIIDIVYGRGESYKTWADKKKEEYDDKLKAIKVRHAEQMKKYRDASDRDKLAERMASGRKLATERRKGAERLKQEKSKTKQKISDARLGERMAAGREMSAVKRDYNERITQEKNRANQKLDDLKLAERMASGRELASARRKFDDKIRLEKAKNRAKEEARKRREARKKFRKRIEKDWSWLADRVLKPTKEKPIPEPLRQPLAELLVSIDTQSERSKKIEEKRGVKGQKTLRLDGIKSALSDMSNAKSKHYDSAWDVISDDRVISLIEELEEKGELRIDELSEIELESIARILKQLKFEIGQMNKLFTESKNVYDKGEAIITETDYIGQTYKTLFGRVGGHIKNILNGSFASPVDFFELLGEEMNSLYIELRKADDKYMSRIDESNKFLKELAKDSWNKKTPGSKFKDWRSKKNAKEFENLDGQTVKLTPAQIMSIYLGMRREQTCAHMIYGAGFVVADDSMKRGIVNVVGDKKSERTNATPIHFSESQLREIVDTLTDEQKAVADKLQKFLVDNCAEWGNETYMKMYGYKKFTDPNYFPITSDKNYLDANFEKSALGIMESIKNFGFTKDLVKNANNPIIIGDAFTIATRHMNEMALFNSFAPAIADFTRVWNYKRRDEEFNLLEASVQASMQNAYGDVVGNYVNKFMADVQGQNRSFKDSWDFTVSRLIGNSMKASIAGNFRVAIQQPTAIVRALDFIDLKYFAKMDHTPNIFKHWSENDITDIKEMIEHCGVAKRKAYGFSQVNLARSMDEIMMNEWSVIDLFTTMPYTQLDLWTWSKIWKAVKAETKDKMPGLIEGSKEYWDYVSERASYIFDHSQVVDSPLHRPDVMRKQDTGYKAITAFMSEPLRSYNMVRTDIIKSMRAWKEGDRSKARNLLSKSLIVYISTAFATAIAQSIADSLRAGAGYGGDDDKDKTFLEFILENWKYNANMLNNIPIASSMASYLKGYSSKNMALDGIGQVLLASKDLFDWLTGEETKKGPFELIWNLIESTSYVTGIPIRNIVREINTFITALGIDVHAAEEGEEQNVVQQMVGFFSGNGKKSKSNGNDTEGAKADIDYGIYEDTVPKSSLGNTLLYKLSGGNLGMSNKAWRKKKEDEAYQQRIDELKALNDPDAIYSMATRNYTKMLEVGDIETIKEMKRTLAAAGGDVERFEKNLEREVKSRYKKELGKDNVTVALKMNQMLSEEYGYTFEEISREVLAKSDMAKKFQKLAATGNYDEAYLIACELGTYGLLQRDLDVLWEKRWSQVEAVTTGEFSMPANGRISSNFGMRWGTLHAGMDIAMPVGTSVSASDGGEVTYIGYDNSRGLYVDIKHRNGYVTRYQHLSSYSVQKGQKVKKGENIAASGNTGNSTGPHLHFAVYQATSHSQCTHENAIDPREFL